MVVACSKKDKNKEEKKEKKKKGVRGMGIFESSRKENKTGSCQQACRPVGSEKVLVKAAPSSSVLCIGNKGQSQAGAEGAAAGTQEEPACSKSPGLLFAFPGRQCT